MAGPGTVTVRILGDASDLDRALGGLHSSFGKIAAVASGTALAGVGAFLKGSLDAAAEAQKVASQTEAVLKSTGAAANVTSQHVGDLAHSLQMMSGVQDETIQTGQNMLLTFTNIKNGVGAGNDIFDQATKTMLDMSVAMGGDVKSTAIQLGKAINDLTINQAGNVGSLSALRRVGVTFSDQQKEQIKDAIKAGDNFKAQKLILAELNKEFGGSAKAAGDAMTPMEKLSMRFGDMQEAIGSKLLPALSSATNFLLEKVGPVFGDIGNVLQGVGSAFSMLAHGDVEGFGISMDAMVKTVIPGAQSMEATFDRVGKGIRDTLAELSKFFQDHKAQVVAVLTQLRETFSSEFTAIVTIVTTEVQIVLALWDRFGRNLIDNFGRAFGDVAEVLRGALEILKGVFDLIAAVLTGKWGAAWDALKEIASGAFTAIAGIVRLGLEAVRTTIENALNLISAVWSATWNGIKSFLSGLIGSFRDLGENIINGIREGLDAGFERLKNTWNKIVSHLPGFLKDRLEIHSPSQVMFNLGSDVVQGLIDGIDGKYADVQASATKMVSAVQAAVSTTRYELTTLNGLTYKSKDGLTFSAPKSPDIQFRNPTPLAPVMPNMEFRTPVPTFGLDTGTAALNGIDFTQVASVWGRWEGGKLAEGNFLMKDGTLRQAGRLYTQDELAAIFNGFPSFGAGGIVPGPIGKPMIAMVHGGEEFSGVGRSLGSRDLGTFTVKGMKPGEFMSTNDGIALLKRIERQTGARIITGV